MSDTEHAKDQAKAQLESITELMAALDKAEANGTAELDGDTLDADAIRERINEDPLEVLVRNDWHAPGAEDAEATEYLILLCTGGPAVRIVGDLTGHEEPDTARLEYQDWFTPWIEYLLTEDENAVLLRYAQQFYFGG